MSEPTRIKDFPGRAVDAHLKATGLLPSEQADCECPNCGRLHKTLGFGKPPATRDKAKTARAEETG